MIKKLPISFKNISHTMRMTWPLIVSKNRPLNKFGPILEISLTFFQITLLLLCFQIFSFLLAQVLPSYLPRILSLTKTFKCLDMCLHTFLIFFNLPYLVIDYPIPKHT